MESWPIGEVARRTGLQPSAIRYYELVDLLPKPRRQNGRRIYGSSILQSLAVIALARNAGFSIAEIRSLINGFSQSTSPSTRWRFLATRKLSDLQKQIKRIKAMEQVLRRLLDCQCLTLQECGSVITERAQEVEALIFAGRTQHQKEK